MSIQVLKPKYHVDECLEQIKECLEIGWTGLGFKTVEFENAWKDYLAAGRDSSNLNAHFLNSCTIGLDLAVEILKKENGWNNGDEVITTPITFVSTNHAILHSQLKPVFADVDEYLCLDPEDVVKKITDKTRAVIFVGYGGRVGQLQKVLEICQKNNLRLILDAAHMSGTRVDGVAPGTWNGVDCAVYSYQAVKNLPTADAGMICFEDREYDEICRKLTWLGINKDTYARTTSQGAYKWKYDVDYLGYKGHGNSIMAAIALAQLPYLDEDNKQRRHFVKIYDQMFAKNDKVKVVPAPYADECSYHIYEIIVDDRDGLMNYLSSKEIFTGVHYRDNTEYRLYSEGAGTCPYAHEVSQHILTLPLHLNLDDDDVKLIATEVNNFTKDKA